MIVFISGTDTDIGKTTVGCALAHALIRQNVRVGVSKPVATGAVERQNRKVSLDAIKLMRAAKVPFETYDEVNPVLFDPPISPHLAARRAKVTINFGMLKTRLLQMEKSCDVLLVEGIGGAATPLSDTDTWADFMARFTKPQTVLVTHPRVGTLNHTLTAIEYLHTRKIAVPLIVVSKFDPADPRHVENEQELARLTRLPVFRCDKSKQIDLGALMRSQLRL